MRKIHFSVICFILLACTTITAWAIVPPPPVNQNLGIPDTQFQILFDDPLYAENTCKRCHKPEYFGLEPPAGIPALQSTYLPNRHHQHVAGTPNAVRGGLIAGGAEEPPFPDADDHANASNPDTHYQCLNCHAIAVDANGQPNGLVDNFRNCFNCHIVDSGDKTVHHDTPKARAGECGICHGYLIRSLDEGMPAATYRPSMITPWRSNKPNADTTVTSTAGTNPGNCNFCHNTIDGGINGTPDGTSDFSNGFGDIPIFQNYQNHHATGVPTFTPAETGSSEAVCTWCHIAVYPAGYTPGPTDPATPDLSWGIRGCERCHDIQSLHSIEADVAGDGIVPGGEERYNGHIGHQDNCWGCHGNDGDISVGSAAGVFISTSIPAQLNKINASTWPEGTSFDLTLLGNAFVNLGSKWNTETNTWDQHTYLPEVQFTDSDGNVTVLTPFTQEPSQAVVSIPDTLAAGSYKVQIKKDLALSNPLGVEITSTIGIRTAICYDTYNIVLLRGDNISSYLPGGVDATGTGVTGDGVEAQRVYRWSGGMVAARFSDGCPTTVELTNIFDKVTITPSVR